MPSSLLTWVPSGVVTVTICSSNRPSSWAAAAFSCEARLNSSSWARDSFQRSAIISAPMPWFGTTPSYRARKFSPNGQAPATDEPIGTRLIDSTPPATTTSYWPDTTPAAAKWTDCGQPAASTALRPMSKVCSPTWLTQPQITSSTTAGSRPVRAASAWST